MACKLLVFSRGFSVHIWLVNLQEQSEWLFPTGDNSAMLFWLFSHCLQAFGSRFLTQMYFKQRSVGAYFQTCVTPVPSYLSDLNLSNFTSKFSCNSYRKFYFLTNFCWYEIIIRSNFDFVNRFRLFPPTVISFVQKIPNKYCFLCHPHSFSGFFLLCSCQMFFPQALR